MNPHPAPAQPDFPGHNRDAVWVEFTVTGDDWRKMTPEEVAELRRRWPNWPNPPRRPAGPTPPTE